jgi:glycosyltransferase involved in cell wall biosynthesis
VLIDTIVSLLNLEQRAGEILVIDQTLDHSAATEGRLRKWDQSGEIRWLRLQQPSIPQAMNLGLLSASFDIVLFVDDDIVPYPGLVAAHVDAHARGHRLVAGRVLQPWDDDVAGASWSAKRFASSESRDIEEFMGGNFSVRRKEAIGAGGFDENFVRVAYNFEREFADRWRSRGGRVQFVPLAAIRHLKAGAGGTRSFGDHLRTILPAHSVGSYYYLLRSKRATGRVREFLGRPLRSIATRHHLRRPWWIPVTLVSELSGMAWALMLNARGPRYCSGRPQVCD